MEKIHGNKGKTRPKISIALIGNTRGRGNKGKTRLDITGSNNFNWKGESVEYRALHNWVERKLGKPTNCEICGVIAGGHQMHWANLSGKYKRDINDWKRMCSKCHGIYDKFYKLRKRK